MNKIKVLVIDDSVLIRKILTEILNSSADIEVVGTAADPLIARDLIKQLNPDVLTLDIEMPNMDGITFLKNLMRLRPTPVVMISTLTEKGAGVTLEALTIGAVDFIAKPKVDVVNSLGQYAEEIISKVRMAARANIANRTPAARVVDKSQNGMAQAAEQVRVRSQGGNNKIIALGASTGGTEAIKCVVRDFPANAPAVVITQHLPVAFSESFVRHIDAITEMTALIPKNGQIVESGHIYLAPGDRHMEIALEGGKYVIRLLDTEPVNRHKPAVDVMFRSVAKVAGANSIAVLLTGMGADGAAGMKQMHDVGAKTVIQDEATSVVWGMPGAAFKLGCADFVLPLDEVATKTMALL
jgi:two-component system, chemotaxis family, protein-glutamate methylesterase/glutaminase